MTSYVLGFAFSEDDRSVLLILKNRPAFQAGKWNGVGGKIEASETAHQAMVREFREETGLDWSPASWEEVGKFGEKGVFSVSVFAARGAIEKAQSLTDEPVAVHALADVETLSQAPDLAPLLSHLSAQGYGRGQAA